MPARAVRQIDPFVGLMGWTVAVSPALYYNRISGLEHPSLRPIHIAIIGAFTGHCFVMPVCPVSRDARWSRFGCSSHQQHEAVSLQTLYRCNTLCRVLALFLRDIVSRSEALSPARAANRSLSDKSGTLPSVLWSVQIRGVMDEAMALHAL